MFLTAVWGPHRICHLFLKKLTLWRCRCIGCLQCLALMIDGVWASFQFLLLKKLSSVGGDFWQQILHHTFLFPALVFLAKRRCNVILSQSCYQQVLFLAVQLCPPSTLWVLLSITAVFLTSSKIDRSWLQTRLHCPNVPACKVHNWCLWFSFVLAWCTGLMAILFDTSFYI